MRIAELTETLPPGAYAVEIGVAEMPVIDDQGEEVTAPDGTPVIASGPVLIFHAKRPVMYEGRLTREHLQIPLEVALKVELVTMLAKMLDAEQRAALLDALTGPEAPAGVIDVGHAGRIVRGWGGVTAETA